MSGCDLPEFCLGDRASCPDDLHKFNGIQCSHRKVLHSLNFIFYFNLFEFRQVCIDKKCARDGANKGFTMPKCQVNCTDNGVCNNLGKCYCQAGFHPPDCKLFGSGGSEDGGYSYSSKSILNLNLLLISIDYILYIFHLYLVPIPFGFVMLTVVPIISFLFFLFFYFLEEDKKAYLKLRLQKMLSCCPGDRLRKTYGGLRPVPLNQSTSIDKSTQGEDQDQVEKRDFSKWVKTRVSLTLPSINIPSISSSLSPMSGCSTATTMSALNTPDDAQFTPVTLLHQPGINDKKVLLTPPVHRLRPAPPPPSKFEKHLNDASNKKTVESGDNRAQVSNEKQPPPPPPNSAKPRSFPFRPPPK